MIRSMTGFGQAERTGSGWRCGIELRSVNGRYLDIRLKLPNGLGYLDDALKGRIKNACERGKIDGLVTLVPDGQGEHILRLNRPLLENYAAMLREAGEVLERPPRVSLGDLLAVRDLIAVKNWEERRGEVEQLVGDTLQEALNRLLAMRETEGAALRATLLKHTAAIEILIEQMAPLTRELPALYAQKLRENLIRLSEGPPPNDERIMQEITLFADRCDVTEEFARIAAHLAHLHQILGQGGAVGRKFEFLLQELNREANTLGVKSSSIQVSTHIIDMKSEIEKLREQIQNIE